MLGAQKNRLTEMVRLSTHNVLVEKYENYFLIIQSRYICICQAKKRFKHKSVNIFLPFRFNICFGCSRTQHSDAGEARTRGPTFKQQSFSYVGTGLPGLDQY